MTRAEENRLQLVANEIDISFTFLESAQLSYSMGHTEHGQQAQTKAEAAYAGALRFLEGQSSQEAVSLQDRATQLRAALDSFEPPAVG